MLVLATQWPRLWGPVVCRAITRNLKGSRVATGMGGSGLPSPGGQAMEAGVEGAVGVWLGQ